jgi:hypothetical protein
MNTTKLIWKVVVFVVDGVDVVDVVDGVDISVELLPISI